MVDGGIPYPILSDVNGNIGKLYDVYNSQSGKTLRGTFIIDSEGYIHGMELLTSPIGRCSEEILRLLKAFQNYVTTGELTPADWNPGDKTIVDSVETAGQIWKQWKPKKYN